ncbi:MAG: hypothetical protein U5L02_07840 [Rheinheimera sp.]|nr:hypothetical protein [Rheinheimera sp.]
MKSLQEHRESIKNNSNAYLYDIPRCYETAVKHIKDAGYTKITLKRAPDIVKNFVDYIFESQNERPFFHIESTCGLPFCWNSPYKGGWDIDYIKYEWGHLNSKNQNGDAADCIQNICLQSSRCNQHIQSSMNVIELLEYGGKLAEVINTNIHSRELLFQSRKWFELLDRLEEWR